MGIRNRRQFLADWGRWVIAAGVGPLVAEELGSSRLFAEENEGRLTFGEQERLVSLLEETPPEEVARVVTQQLQQGVSLADLVAAAALGNARKFGGHDYVGYHTFMAMAPALDMAHRMPQGQQPLPIIKVLYRNAARMQETGGAATEALRPIHAQAALSTTLRESVHARDVIQAEQVLAQRAAESPQAAYSELLDTVEENADVHRVVLASRVWDMLELVGQRHAETMLRQSVRYCIDNETWRSQRPTHPPTLLPRLLDQYRLLDPAATRTRHGDDRWIETFHETIFRSTPEAAAEAVAAALAEGFALTDVFEAIALATNQLVLRDAGRTGRQVQPNKPEGSVHGDSIGVHASDSSHAWRRIAMAAGGRHAVCAAILAGYQAALDRVQRGGDFLNWQPRPNRDVLERLHFNDPQVLLDNLHHAIRGNDQEMACAVTHRYGEMGYPPEELLRVLLSYGVTEDGALHAEKYFRTTTEEFTWARPRFRWRHLVGLARVTASAYGFPAPGVQQAKQQLTG